MLELQGPNLLRPGAALGRLWAAAAELVQEVPRGSAPLWPWAAEALLSQEVGLAGPGAALERRRAVVAAGLQGLQGLQGLLQGPR